MGVGGGSLTRPVTSGSLEDSSMDEGILFSVFVICRSRDDSKGKVLVYKSM